MKKTLISTTLLALTSLFFSVNATRLGTPNNEWKIDQNKLSEESNCYLIGTHKDFDLAVGLLEVIGCNVYLVGNANKKYIETLQENIYNQKVAYVDYRKTYVLNPSNAKKIYPMPTDNFACLAHKKIDLLKCDASVINTDILKKVIQEKHPYIICLGSCITSESNTRNAYSFLTQEGYTATYVNHNRNAITFTHQATSSSTSLQDIAPLKTSTDSMDIQECFVDLFQNEPVKTEYYAYQYIQQYPIKANAPYLAVPWSRLIHNHLFNKSAASLDRALSIRSSGSFTVCQHILYEKILHIMKHIGVQTLFTPHVDKQFFGLTVKPFPHFAVCGPLPAEKKDIWYSLVGNDTQQTRRLLFDTPHPPEAYV